MPTAKWILKEILWQKWDAFGACGSFGVVLGGLAEGIEQSAYIESYSPATGVSSSVLQDDGEAIAKLSVGRGLANSAKELQKFYIELAQQTMPVLEVGPTKKVNLVISEGVNLEIAKQPETEL